MTTPDEMLVNAIIESRPDIFESSPQGRGKGSAAFTVLKRSLGGTSTFLLEHTCISPLFLKICPRIKGHLHDKNEPKFLKDAYITISSPNMPYFDRHLLHGSVTLSGQIWEYSFQKFEKDCNTDTIDAILEFSETERLNIILDLINKYNSNKLRGFGDCVENIDGRNSFTYSYWRSFLFEFLISTRNMLSDLLLPPSMAIDLNRSLQFLHESWSIDLLRPRLNHGDALSNITNIKRSSSEGLLFLIDWDNAMFCPGRCIDIASYIKSSMIMGMKFDYIIDILNNIQLSLNHIFPFKGNTSLDVEICVAIALSYISFLRNICQSPDNASNFIELASRLEHFIRKL